MGLVTVTLKLFKPSKIKQAMLAEAMSRYDEAFMWLASKASERLDEFYALAEQGIHKRSARHLRTWIDKGMSRELNQFQVEPFKDALKNDFSAYMAGYLARWVRSPKIPFAPSRSQSVLFCRYDTKRDWCLVYNPIKDRFYAKLFLLNRDGSVINKLFNTAGKLIHIHIDRTPLTDTTRMVRYLLFPLAFGKKQEKLLKEAVLKPEMFRSARVFSRKGEWYLSACIENETPAPLATEFRIGFSRAMDSAFSWSISNAEQGLIAQGFEQLPLNSKCKDGSWSLNGLHLLTNRMVHYAEKYEAQAVVAQLSEKGDHLHWIGADNSLNAPLLDGRTWNRILLLLKYKLPVKGLPAPVTVSPNNMFRACPNCKMTTKRNRMSRTQFLCIRCGHTQPLDEVGSLNLSRRLQQYEKSLVPVTMQTTTKGYRFRQASINLDVELTCPLNANPSHCFEALDKILFDIVHSEKNEVGGTLSPSSPKRYASVIRKLERHKLPTQGIQLVFERSKKTP